MTLSPLRHPWLFPAAAAAVAVIVLLVAPRSAGPAYMGAFLLASCLPLGAAAWLMVGHLTGGDWFSVIKPRLEAGSAGSPILAALILPIVILSPSLFPWAHHESGSVHPYFSTPAVALRETMVLATWILGGPSLAIASRSVPAGTRAGPGLRAGCAAGLILYVLTTTAMAFDFLEALQAHWSSSIFGVIVVCSQALTGLGLVAGAAAVDRSQPPPPEVLADLGNLILAMVLVHAYVAFSQFFIIWNGDVPDRTSWYLPRTQGFWLGAVILIALLQFAFPFAGMIFRAIKTSSLGMAVIAAVLLAGASLESVWMTLPSSPADGVMSRALYLVLGGCLSLTVLTLSRTPHAPGTKGEHA